MRKPTRCRETGKLRYYDRLAAKMALARIWQTDSSKRPKMEHREYRCPHCRGWHLTSR